MPRKKVEEKKQDKQLVQLSGKPPLSWDKSILSLLYFTTAQVLAFWLGELFLFLKVSVVDNPSDVGNSISLFAYVIGTALMLLLILKYYKGRLLFYAFELMLLFTTSTMFLSVFFNDLTSIILGVLVVAVRVLVKELRNPLLLFSSALVGALLGSSLDLLPAAILALLLSAYDFIAVFYTKHMVTLAKELGDRDSGFSITMGKDAGSVELGTGDLVIPAMLLTSAKRLSFFYSLTALCGAVIGFGILLYLLQKRRGYYPALPPIVASMLVLLGAQWLLIK